ncbi:hypothetical protein Dimus_002912, partial [Dionaea muscipula]
ENFYPQVREKFSVLRLLPPYYKGLNKYRARKKEEGPSNLESRATIMFSSLMAENAYLVK